MGEEREAAGRCVQQALPNKAMAHNQVSVCEWQLYTLPAPQPHPSHPVHPPTHLPRVWRNRKRRGPGSSTAAATTPAAMLSSR